METRETLIHQRQRDTGDHNNEKTEAGSEADTNSRRRDYQNKTDKGATA